MIHDRERAGLRVLLPGLMLVAALTGPVPSPGEPPSRSLPQAAGVERVISVVPAATETLFAMGAGDLMVGVGSYDRWPPAARELPRVGAYLDPDLERMIALRPDLAVIDAGQRDLARQLDAAGIGVFRFRHGGLDDAIRTMRELGAAVGRRSAGEALAAAVREDLEALERRLADRPRPEVLLVFGRSGGFGDLWVVGGRQFLHEILVIVGGRNVFGEVERLSFQVGLETVLSRRPDVVLELTPGGTGGDEEGAGERGTPGGDAERAVRQQWRRLPGFEDVRVELLPPDALVPGPRMPEVARHMAEMLHGADALAEDRGKDGDG
ncbi:MAG: ABC transporter substrate-binding protein [Acidobacteriota bacterium]